MLRVHFIDSLDLPELEPYRTMRRSIEHERRGIFVAEGEKVVRRLLKTRLTVVSLLTTPEWLEKLRSQLEVRPEEIQAYVAEKNLLQAMIGFTLYQGVLAVAKIPAPLAILELIKRCPRPRLFVALDGLTNSENLGVLVRNCAAFGVQALLVGETCSSPWLRRAVRNSMGAIFHVPTAQTQTLALELRALNDSGISTVGAHPHASGKTLSETVFTRDCCIVFGSEGYGLSPAVLAACAELVAVPMPAEVDSLNVSSAAAVFLYEVARQRRRI